jgi:Protein of unknown function (DUF1266)
MRVITCLTAILLGSLVLTPRLWPAQDEGMTAPPPGPIPSSVPEQDKERAVKEWALGCAAVLTERNHDSHTLLAGDELTEESRVATQKLLSGAWGVNSRAELFDTLASLDEKGHRADFAKIGRVIWPLSQEIYEGFLAGEDDPEVINKMRVAREYYVQLGHKSLHGWDYSRAICLCRWAYTVGYLSEEEAWERILPMARLLQTIFDSWEDLGQNYLIGRRFWSCEDTNEDGWRYEDAVQRLLDMRDSPWNQQPWDLDLSGGNDAVPDEPHRRLDILAACR